MDYAEFNKQVIAAFRDGGGEGEVGPVHLDRVVLLTTTGRHSGQPRTVPLGRAVDAAGNLLLFASNMGDPKPPDWFRNIETDPHVAIEIGDRSYDTVAEILSGDERADAYRRWLEMAPHTADHQHKAGRQIPMLRIPKPPV